MRTSNALTGGRWVPRGGVVVWVPDGAPTQLELARLKAARRQRPRPPKFAPRIAVNAAAFYFSIEADAITAGGRQQPHLDARRVAMWLMRQDGYSYPRIGSVLHRDHTTVIHNIRALENDRRLLDVARQIRSALAGEAAA